MPFVLFFWVSALLPLSGSLILCYHGDGMLPISLPLNPLHHLQHHHLSFSLTPLLTVLQCYHGDTCLSPLCRLPVSHVSLGQSLRPYVCLLFCLSVCRLCALGLPFFVYSFVCLFVWVLCTCMIVCLDVSLRPSLSVFAFCLTLFSLCLSG